MTCEVEVDLRLPTSSSHRVWFFLAGALFLSLFALSPLSAAETNPDPETLVRSVQELQFDTGHTMSVKDLSLHFESVILNFERGRMVFAKPVAGVVTGVYFWGEGTIIAGPPSVIEKQQLNLFTGAPTLNEHFREAYIRFTDNSYELLMKQARASPETEFRPLDIPSDSFQRLLMRAGFDSYRIVADLLDGRVAPVFTAHLLGYRFGLFDFILDYRRREQVSLGQSISGPNRIGYDVWCSYSLPSRVSEPFSLARNSSVQGGDGAGDSIPLIDSQSYEVETRIDKNDKINGTSRVEFLGEIDGEWVLSFDMSRSMRLTRVTDEKGRALAFCQNDATLSAEELERTGQDIVMVLLKDPLRHGERRTLEFEYSGEVISRAGSGVFYVGSRGSWYPNTGILDRARYRLKFQCPKSMTIVATGDLVKEWEEGDIKHSEWTSDIPIPIAGFNYGDYMRKSAKVGDIPVDVYTNRGVESVYLEVKSRLEILREIELQRQQALRRREEINSEFFPSAPDLTDFDTSRFSNEIATRVARTLQFYEPILTQYPYHKLAVSQIPGRFSQGWPSLLYVSSLAFLTKEQRVKLGMESDREALIMECLPAHELAHQWWGNLVGWKSYHDVWMMEGFSNYFGYLSVKLRYPSEKPFRELLRQSRDRILSKNTEGETIESAGPVWLSSRLGSSKFPHGYSILAYEKGAWILHMLRCLLTDPVSDSDQQFQELIHDFFTTYRDRLASTQDFKKLVEKYMSKELDLEGNHRLDWFFDEWVYGTGIPTYRLSYSTSALKNGAFLVKGKIIQENVPDYFMMPVEVFGHYAQQRVQRIGRVDVTGYQTPFKFTLKSKPTKLTLDENGAILCENKTL